MIDMEKFIENINSDPLSCTWEIWDAEKKISFPKILQQIINRTMSETAVTDSESCVTDKQQTLENNFGFICLKNAFLFIQFLIQYFDPYQMKTINENIVKLH